jgi:hypothetical protein
MLNSSAAAAMAAACSGIGGGGIDGLFMVYEWDKGKGEENENSEGLWRMQSRSYYNVVGARNSIYIVPNE